MGKLHRKNKALKEENAKLKLEIENLKKITCCCKEEPLEHRVKELIYYKEKYKKELDEEKSKNGFYELYKGRSKAMEEDLKEIMKEFGGSPRIPKPKQEVEAVKKLKEQYTNLLIEIEPLIKFKKQTEEEVGASAVMEDMMERVDKAEKIAEYKKKDSEALWDCLINNFNLKPSRCVAIATCLGRWAGTCEVWERGVRDFIEFMEKNGYLEGEGMGLMIDELEENCEIYYEYNLFESICDEEIYDKFEKRYKEEIKDILEEAGEDETSGERNMILLDFFESWYFEEYCDATYYFRYEGDNDYFYTKEEAESDEESDEESDVESDED